MYLFFVYRTDFISLIGLSTDSWYSGMLGIIAFLIGCIFSALFGFLTASIAGGYFIELLIEKLMVQANIKSTLQTETFTDVVMSMVRAIFNEAILVTGILFCTVLAFLLSFIPFLAFLPILAGMLIAGFTLLNLPLAILDLPIRKRLYIIKKQLLPCLALGGCFTGVLFIPFGSILLLPAFYGAAVELLAQNKELLPSPNKKI